MGFLLYIEDFMEELTTTQKNDRNRDQPEKKNKTERYHQEQEDFLEDNSRERTLFSVF